MSYLRFGSIFKYVDGDSKDYVFPSAYKDGDKLIDFIEDYGSISNEAIIEILFNYAKLSDGLCPSINDIFKQHILKRLAENLNVKLREVPLTDEQLIELELGRVKKIEFDDKYSEQGDKHDS